MNTTISPHRLAALLLLAAVGGCSGADDAAKAKKKPPMMVAVEAAAPADYVPRLDALGTVTPLQSVAVRTRVDGQIVAVLFKEGDTVHAGQPLFRLDDRAARAQLAQGRAALAAAAATSAQAAADLKRSQALVANGFVSKATLELKDAAAQTGRAGIDQARASIANAEAQLSYLTIRAPVSGRTGEIGYKIGAAVRAADATPLVTVNQLSPITVRFAVPPEGIQTLRTASAAGTVGVVASDRDSGARLATGRLVFLDNNVDAATGALAAKAEFDNTHGELWPGGLVGISVPMGATKRLVAVTEAAVQNGRDGSFVWTVGGGDTVAMQPVSIAGRAGGRAYLAGGITPGTRVVTDALNKLKPGDPVRIKGGHAAGARA